LGIEKYDIIDSSFSTSDSSSYNLSILVGLDRFVYSITNENHKLLLLKTNLFTEVSNYIEQKKSIQLTIEDNEQLSLPYAKVTIALFDQNTVLVPSTYYDDSQLTGYLKTLLHGNQIDQFQADNLPTLEVHHLYEVNGAIKNQLLSYYPQATLMHLNTSLLSYLSQLDTTKQGTNIYINTIAYNLSAFVFKDGQVLMVNNYQFKSTKDYLYFIMLIFNQLELDKSNTKIHLGGEVAKTSQAYNLVKKYYPAIEFMDRPAHMKWPNQFLNTPDHYFIDLFSLTLCE